MKTLVTESIKKAASFIKKGEVVAFPTETVYGLGANVYDIEAIKKIYTAKGRPFDNPLIVHVASKKDILVLASEIPELAKNIIRDYFPGPITVILRRNELISMLVTAGLGTIAIRMPSSKVALDFIKECGVPIAAPSANLSGSPSPTSYEHVLEDFDGKIPCVLKGPNAKHGLESTVIDCSSGIPHILRPGVITLEQLKGLNERVAYQARTGKIKSPGQKYKHYAPKAKVILLPNGSKELPASDSKKLRAYIGISLPLNLDGIASVRICDDMNDYAKNLFSYFRQCDREEMKIIYAEKVSEEGIGLAIMNRLQKAAK